MADFMTGTAGRHYVELPAEPASVSCAREHVAVVLESLGLTSRELLDDAQLITSELVTNAITATIATGPYGGADDPGGAPARPATVTANGAGNGTPNGAANGTAGGTAGGMPRGAANGLARRNGARPLASRHVGVGARLSGTCLTLEFWDDGAGVPTQVTPGDEDVSGRGLLLVEALSRRWGYSRPAPRGKVVWVELDVSSYLCDAAAR